jgi:hypothetical protein
LKLQNNNAFSFPDIIAAMLGSTNGVALQEEMEIHVFSFYTVPNFLVAIPNVQFPVSSNM